MKTGTVYVYASDNGLGVTKCSKKERYVFERKDWLSERQPEVGILVKFRPEHSMARNIVVIKATDPEDNGSG